MKLLNFFVFCLLSMTIAGGQPYDEPERLPMSLRQLTKRLSVSQRVVLLNRVSFGFGMLFQADSSIYYGEKALLLAEENHLSLEMAKAHNNIGLAMQQLGVHAEAIREFELGTSIARRVGDKELIGRLSYGIGHSYYMMRLYKKGVSQQLNTLHHALKNNLLANTPIVYNDLGLMYMAQKKLDSSRYYFAKNLVMAARTNNEFMLMMANKNLGRVLLLKGLEREGQIYIWKSIEIATKSKVQHIRNSVTLSYECLAEYENTRKNYSKSIYYAKKALEVAQKFNATEDIYDVSKILYEASKALGNTDQALSYLELNQRTYEMMHERLETVNQQALENRLQIARQRLDIGILREEGKSSRQQSLWITVGLIVSVIVGLWMFGLYRLVGNQKNQIDSNNLILEQKVLERTHELEEAYLELKSAVTKGQTMERKLIAADIHDNLGGILSSVAIGMELIDQTGLSNRERQMLKNIKNQISDAYDEIRLLSHNLRPEILEKEGIKVALNRMVQRVTLLHKLEVFLDVCYTRVLPKAVEFNVYAIVTELLNNVLKHSGASKVIISLRENRNGVLVLKVEDDGRGLGNYAHTTKGDGMGIRNIQDRVDQINAIMTHSSISGRTVFSIDIP